MISGHGNIETAVAAIKRGAYDFIEKPFKADRLLLVVERALEAARLRRENAELRLRAGDPSRADRRLAGDRRAAPGDRTRGADRQPRADHRPRRRRQGGGGAPDPRPLAPRRRAVRRHQLRQHAARPHGGRAVRRRGRSEGGERPRKIGTFEQAHGGTLFLDEVADMPLETQGKIVRVLQEQTFERVGGRDRVEVDVRVIASTRTATCAARSPPAASARTCSTGSTWCRSGCRRCASGARTSRSSPATSCRARAGVPALLAARARRGRDGGAAGL